MKLFSRRARATWGDSRLFIGIALVALSITGVWFVVSSAGATTPVLQASRTIVEGDVLVSGDFHVVEVALGAVSDEYMAPQQLRPGLIAERTISEGELLPATAASDADDSRSTTVVIEVGTRLSTDIRAGTLVEVWHAPAVEDGRTYDSPRILVADATVSSVITDGGVLAADATSVEVVIDRADVAEVLAAVTGGSVMSVVAVRASS